MRTRLARLLIAACLLLTLSAAAADVRPRPASETAPAPPPVIGAGQSANITHLANVPTTGPPVITPYTDLAFEGDRAYVGNYGGFQIYDISDPAHPSLISQVACPGGQNDISVYGDLVFLSVDSSRSDNTCSSRAQSPKVKASWEGIRIFDASDLRHPRYIASVETRCGSHTHTLVPDPAHDALYLYNSSFLPDPAYPDCKPPNDRIDIVRVPLQNPRSAAVVASPVLFPDGGFEGSETIFPTSGCHDITVLPDKGIAAGACMGDGILLDISKPAAPVVIDRVEDTDNFSFWHSATFNADGSKVVFTDELGGGGGAECSEEVGPNRGATAVFDIVEHRLVFRSYFKIPRYQAPRENCVSHNGSLVPAEGRDILVQAWYQGGVSVWDFTDSAHPVEIAYFDRPMLPGGEFAGYWSAYYYNGYVYATEAERGLDVFRLSDPRTDSAATVQLDSLNVQSQPSYRH